MPLLSVAFRPLGSHRWFEHICVCAFLTALEKFGKTPLLTDGEMEAQYKMVYNRAMSRGDASAQINLVRLAVCPLLAPAAGCVVEGFGLAVCPLLAPATGCEVEGLGPSSSETKYKVLV